MRMARTITLVLLGGGVVLGGAAMLGGGTGNRDRTRECQEARTANRPDAEQICASARSSSTRSGSGGAWFLGRTGGGSTGPALAGASGFRGDAGASSRGGFGSTARGASSSGG